MARTTPAYLWPTTYGKVMPERQPTQSFIGSAEFDVVVIGGGMTGLTAALELTENKKILLLEALKIGDGPSGRNGGQIIPGFECGIQDVVDMVGRDIAADLWHDIELSRRRMCQRIDAAPDRCDTQDGIIAAAMNAKQLKQLQAEAEVLHAFFNFHAINHLDRTDIKRYVNSPDYLGGILYQDARHINPLKYVQYLAKLVHEKGALIAENSPVRKFSRNPDGSFDLEIPQGQIKTSYVVLACGAQFLRPKGLDFITLGQKFVPAQTVIIATEPMSDAVIKRAFPGTAAVFDARNFLNYLRRTPDNRILFGGVDAITDCVTSISAKFLMQTMYRVLPTLAEDGVKIETYWTGYVDPSRTLLPSVHRLERGLYEASGFSGQGLVLTALAGEAIAEDILTSGKGERLKRLSKIAPGDFSSNPFLAKLQLMKTWAVPLLEDLLACPRGAGRILDKAN